jgi:hypothetical protein
LAAMGSEVSTGTGAIGVEGGVDVQRSWEEDAIQRASDGKARRRLMTGVVSGLVLACLLWGVAAALLWRGAHVPG